MTGCVDGWWWPPAVGDPEDFTRVRGVRAPPLEANADRLVAHLRSTGSGLSARSAVDIAETLGRVGERFQDELLDATAALVSSESGLSLPTSTRVVAGMANGWTRASLTSVLRSEFPEVSVLDSFTETPGADAGGRRLRAFGRGLTVHIGSGSVPGVSVSSMIRGLLVKCPSLVKPGLGDVALTVAFLRALAQEDGELANSAAALYWPGGSSGLAPAEERLFREADQVVIYGSDETVDQVRAATPTRTPLIVHSHRVGVIVAGPGAENALIAEAVCMFDQRGCVSPQILLYMGDEAERWAGSLAAELARFEERLPPGLGSPEARSAVHQLRGAVELRRSAGESVDVIYRDGQSWTLMITPLDDVRPIGMRTLWIIPTPSVASVQRTLNALGPVLQSVGITGDVDSEAQPSANGALSESEWGEVAESAAAAGASRVVPVDALAFPEARWLHDGQGPLLELVRWAEWH